MEVRYAEPTDSKIEISKIYEESWKAAYWDILPHDYLDSIPEGRWAGSLEQPGWKRLVCVEDGRLIGTSSFSCSRLEQYPDCGEVISIYLLPDYVGKGYGRILMEAVLSELKQEGYETVFLWVLEENHMARDFYEHMGFLLAEDFLVDRIGGKEVREVQYVYKFR